VVTSRSPQEPERAQTHLGPPNARPDRIGELALIHEYNLAARGPDFRTPQGRVWIVELLSSTRTVWLVTIGFRASHAPIQTRITPSLPSQQRRDGMPGTDLVRHAATY